MKMKITLALMFVLCLTLSAFAQSDMKKEDKMSKKMTPDQMLMNQEQMAWNAIREKRWDDFGKMLADNYQGFQSDGIHNKSSEMEGIKQMTLNSVSLSDMKVTWIDKNVAMVTSMVKTDGTMPDGTMGMYTARTATIWKKSGKNWRIVYHTDMEMKPAALMTK